MKNINLPVSIFKFLIKNKKILLLKRCNTGFNDRKWSVPAGRLNNIETIRKAAVREAREEVNSLIKISDLSMPLVMHHKDAKGVRIYFFILCEL